MRGRSATAQSSPGEKYLYLVFSIIDNLMARCVARNPKEIVRQVAAAKELDSAKCSGSMAPVDLEHGKSALKVAGERTGDVWDGAHSIGAWQNHRVEVEAMSVSSSNTTSFFTAGTHQGSL